MPRVHAGNRCRPTLICKPRGNGGSAHTEDERDKEDPTQVIPDWLQPFTANLEDLETHVPAHSPEREISDLEGDASKVGQKNGSTLSFLTSPKTEIATDA